MRTMVIRPAERVTGSIQWADGSISDVYALPESREMRAARVLRAMRHWARYDARRARAAGCMCEHGCVCSFL